MSDLTRQKSAGARKKRREKSFIKTKIMKKCIVGKRTVDSCVCRKRREQERRKEGITCACVYESVFSKKSPRRYIDVKRKRKRQPYHS